MSGIFNQGMERAATVKPNLNQYETGIPARAGSVPVPLSAPIVHHSGAMAGYEESVGNMQPAAMAHDDHVESPRVDDDEDAAVVGGNAAN